MFFGNLFGALFDTSKLTGDYAWLKNIADFLNDILIPGTTILSIGAAVLVIAISISLAKAETSDKMNEMKKRLWGVVITFIVVIGLIWLLAWLLPNIGTIIDGIRGA